MKTRMLRFLLCIIAVWLDGSLAFFAQADPKYHFDVENSRVPIDLGRPFTCSTQYAARIGFEEKDWMYEDNASFKEFVDIAKQSKSTIWKVTIDGEKAHVLWAAERQVIWVRTIMMSS